jgi:molybdate transport system substrate-binding protein
MKTLNGESVFARYAQQVSWIMMLVSGVTQQSIIGGHVMLVNAPIYLTATMACVVIATGPATSEDAFAYDPPWEGGPSADVRFTVPGINNVPDLHGDPSDPQLVIFFGGNQFMVLPRIIEAFQEAHPEYERVFYETLPPGIVERQLKEGSLVMGNLKLTLRPDVFVAGQERVTRLADDGLLEEPVPYYRNRLGIMVLEGNPKNIRSWADLGRADVRVSMPDRRIEGIGDKAVEAFGKEGGDDLVRQILEKKRQAGTTFITQMHHRQTPLRILRDESDAGPVWVTEALFQQRIGHPISLVEVPEEQNVSGTAAAARVAASANKEAAQRFIEFLRTDRAKELYRDYGFEPLE